MGEILVLEGKARMRKRRASPQTIDAEQIETFFVTLGDTCNVSRSAREAGFSSSWAYRLRQQNAAFRASWAQAVREGYAKLELVLLERAMKGTPRPIMRRDGTERIVRDYSTQLAVTLLKRHADAADNAAYEPGEDEMRELRDKILAKLDRTRKRDRLRNAGSSGVPALEDAQDGGIETKAALDRVGLILWALGRHSRRALTPLACGESPSPETGEGFPA